MRGPRTEKKYERYKETQYVYIRLTLPEHNGLVRTKTAQTSTPTNTRTNTGISRCVCTVLYHFVQGCVVTREALRNPREALRDTREASLNRGWLVWCGETLKQFIMKGS